MSQSQRTPISAGLIARKGAATTSSAFEPPAQPIANDTKKASPAPAAKTEPTVPLNFHVPTSFKKRFSLAALNEDLNHREFLFWLFDQYEQGRAKAD